MDVRNPDSIKEAVDAIEAQIGLPSIVVNNAAGNFISPFERLSPNAFKVLSLLILLMHFAGWPLTLKNLKNL